MHFRDNNTVEKKVCKKCHRLLPLDAFNKRGGEKYLRTECKECNNRLANRRKELKNIYGMPGENYRCPICNRSEHECRGEGSNRASAWVIDHCHRSNEFRGWLCHKCNRGMGAFNDDIKLIWKVLIYIVKSKFFRIKNK